MRKLNGPVACERTTDQALHDLGYSFRVPPRESLTSAQMLERVEFARAHIIDSWDHVWAGDETTFNLYRLGKKVWCRLSKRTGLVEPARPKQTRKMEKISVSVVGAISFGKKSALGFLQKNWLPADVVKAFSEHVYPSMDWVSRGRHRNTLIWDNDGRHHTRLWKEYVAQAGLEVIRPWPSNSPDLNPIENVWAWMKDYVEKVQPDSEHHLREAIRAAWQAFPIEQTEHLFQSMPARLALCLRLGGGRTRY